MNNPSGMRDCYGRTGGSIRRGVDELGVFHARAGVGFDLCLIVTQRFQVLEIGFVDVAGDVLGVEDRTLKSLALFVA